MNWADISTTILNQKKNHLRSIRAEQRKNSKYTTTEKILDKWKEALRQKFHDIPTFEEFVDKYKQSNNILLDRYHILRNHPDFDMHYFKDLDTEEKNYFYGHLLAEGGLYKRRGTSYIEVGIHQKDHEIVRRFAKAINFRITKLKYIHNKTIDKSTGEVTKKPIVRLRFGSYIFGDHMEAHSFPPGKKSDKIKWPRSLGNRGSYTKNDLSLLLGFYDGDGSSGSKHSLPIIDSKSEMFIRGVKHKFDLPYKVQRRQYFDENGQVTYAYRISLSREIYDKMIESYEFSLARKRVKYRTPNIPFDGKK